MAKFALFFRFTGQSIKGLIDHPSDRAAVVAELCESAGGRMESYYLMFGEWDGFVVAEVPDSKAAAALSLISGVLRHESTPIARTLPWR